MLRNELASELKCVLSNSLMVEGMIISLDFTKISFKFGVAALLLRYHCLLIVLGFCFCHLILCSGGGGGDQNKLIKTSWMREDNPRAKSKQK